MDDESMTCDRGCFATDTAGDLAPTEIATPAEFGEILQMADAAPSGLPDDEPCPELEGTHPAVRASAGASGQPHPEQILEALLFAADTPLSLTRLTELVGDCTPVQVRLHLAALNDKYTMAGLSFRIEQIARGYQMMTLPRFQPWVTKLNQQRSQTRLSAAALETLSIVAYKQPIIRADVEAIRGVACGEVLNRLREMGLVKIIGRAEVVGRPLMYGTTKKFLDVFGLADLDDLPPMEALTLRRTPAAAEPAPREPVDQPSLAASA